MTGERALILGCGYVGQALARALRAENVSVTGTTPRAGSFDMIRAAGAEPVIADVLEPATLRPLLDLESHVVFDLVRPQRIDHNRYTSWGTRNIAATFAEAGLEALVYLSSTAVYGRRSGELTDESTVVSPTSALGRARLEAETIYREYLEQKGLPIRICRAPAIYGPGRTLRERLESGAYRRLDDENIWVSSIHVDDLAAGLIAAWRRGTPGEVYLICDDEPTTGHDYAELTASLLSLPLPPTVERADIRQEMSGDGFDRRIASRRCSNRRMREDLGVVLMYPTIREGLPAALRAEGSG